MTRHYTLFCHIQAVKIRVDQPYSRILGQHFNLFFEFLRDPEIVCIEERDEITFGLGDSAVPGDGGSLVLLADVVDAAAKRFEDIFRVISGSVIHDDHVLGEKRLGQHTLNGLWKEYCRIVRRYDDTDSRFVHGSAPKVQKLEAKYDVTLSNTNCPV